MSASDRLVEIIGEVLLGDVDAEELVASLCGVMLDVTALEILVARRRMLGRTSGQSEPVDIKAHLAEMRRKHEADVSRRATRWELLEAEVDDDVCHLHRAADGIDEMLAEVEAGRCEASILTNLMADVADVLQCVQVEETTGGPLGRLRDAHERWTNMMMEVQ